MKYQQREVWLALSRVPIYFPRWKHLDIVSPVAPGRAWGTPWLDYDRSDWDDAEMPEMDPIRSKTSLCFFCQYADWWGSSCEGGDVGMECKHPLTRFCAPKGDHSEGGDCWGFRPRKGLNIDVVTEFVGQRLQQQFVNMP